jgi:hypothetical protein
VEEPLTLDDFAPRVGERFALRIDGREDVALELLEARGLGPGYEQREAFALLFRGPADPPLPQATYRLAHAGLGDLEIFIVPVAQGEAGRDYEAIFS